MSERKPAAKSENPRKADTVERAWLVNPGTTPLVYDADGRVIPAGERRRADALDAVGAAAVANGYLTIEKIHEPATGDEGDSERSGASTRD